MGCIDSNPIDVIPKSRDTNSQNSQNPQELVPTPVTPNQHRREPNTQIETRTFFVTTTQLVHSNRIKSRHN